MSTSPKSASESAPKRPQKPRKPRNTYGPHPYSGALANPIPLPAPAGILMTEEQWTERRKQAYAEGFREKVPLLFEHFQIPLGDWQSLAILLAQTHVPGFLGITPERRGPKRFWTRSMMILFMEEMQTEVDGPKKRSISDAAKTLARRPEWKERLKQHCKPAEVLRRKYHELMETSAEPQDAEKPAKPLGRQK